MKTAKTIILSIVFCFAGILPLQAEQQASEQVNDKFKDAAISVEASFVVLNSDAKAVIDSMADKEKTNAAAAKILELVKDKKNGEIAVTTRVDARNGCSAQVTQNIKSYYLIDRSTKDENGKEIKNIEYRPIESLVQFEAKTNVVEDDKIVVEYSFIKNETIINSSDDKMGMPGESTIKAQSILMLKPGVPQIAAMSSGPDKSNYLIISANFEGKAKY